MSGLIGFDDAAFDRDGRGKVPVIGVICARSRVDGVVAGRVRRDGADATRELARLVQETRFRETIRSVLIHGIAVAGFNVIDIHALHAALKIPVLVVCRKDPDLVKIRAALDRVRGGDKKWALIQQAGRMEPCAGLYVQRAGLTLDGAAALLQENTVSGALPESLRMAHLIGGAMGRGFSRGRA